MFASSFESRAKRRGIVLVVVLGMLGLMALIGVTFATFAGQSLIASRNFGQGVSRPQAEALMDYALAQLINDTSNPVSAIRGHSLLRDMYGNDSVFRGANPTANPAAETGGLLSQVYVQGVGTQTLHFTGFQQRTAEANTGPTAAFYNQIEYQTNIPTQGQYYGLDFTRWIIRFPNNNYNNTNFSNNAVPQTFEILEDNSSGNYHTFTLAGNLINQTTDPNSNPSSLTAGDWTPFIYFDPNLGATVNSGSISKGYTSLAKEINPLKANVVPPVYGPLGVNANALSAPFVLDGRYMRAFNGSGLTRTDLVGLPTNQNTGFYPYNFAAYANFRINGSLLNGNTSFSAIPGDPDSAGLDEDYDACDLENWFLAIQSADGQVVIPSFHRPGILNGPSLGKVNDWTVNSPIYNNGPWGNPKILRPRQADNSPLFPADPSTTDPTTGKLTYDIDNDGDGVTDSVWLDLGYPVQRDPGGKLYKPLFAFMILGLNGRLPLNTVGNLQARAIGDQTNILSTKTGETLPDGTAPGASGLNNASAKADATTQVPYPGTTTGQMSPDSLYFQAHLSSQVYLDAPLWDHTSHLGYSVNEINPKFALQNAPSNLYPNTAVGATLGSPYGVYPNDYTSATAPSYSQYDNVGVSVALTQLRNILAGTIPTDTKNTLTAANNLSSNGYINYSSLSPTPVNNDLNVVIVNGKPMVLPNNVADLGDFNGTTGVSRPLPPVAGRWGESSGVPQALLPPSQNPALSSNQPILYPTYWYNNPVRAGRSFYITGTNDAMDDDFDSFDPYLPSSAQTANTYSIEQSITSSATPYQLPLNLPTTTPYTGSATFNRTHPEFVDFFDSTGQMGVASERSRRFVAPLDPSGSGRVVGFLNRPNNDNDFGSGYDAKGRTSFFRYFRPAGMPQEIRYPYSTSTGSFVAPYPTNSTLAQQYLMPVLFPAGYSANSTPSSVSDTSNNKYHGYQSGLTPTVNLTSAQNVGAMGAMAYDWDLNANMQAGGPPPGYGYGYDAMGNAQPNRVNLLAPTINPNGVLQSSLNSTWGPNLPAGISTNYFISYGNVPSPNGQTQPSVVNGYLGSLYNHPSSGTPYITGGGLNMDEADEMNLYNPSLFDQAYGPSDLEWLYRLQDVDGSTLSSRLSKLAPISFLNPSDGLTRRRLFSTDSWELNRFAYANDNPVALQLNLNSNSQFTSNVSSNGQFLANSRFLPYASPSLENMNQVVQGSTFQINQNQKAVAFNPAFANPVTTEFLPNPTFPQASTSTINNNDITKWHRNQASSGTNFNTMPYQLAPHDNNSDLFSGAFYTATISNGVVQPYGTPSTLQVQTPSVAHGDRKINLNFPLPIANDPAEPIRQKWCRETYQLLKAILPPSSIDTPEELAQLSQFVVNIIDFRDTDCTMTRFVNTDLEVTDVLTKAANNIQYDSTRSDPLTYFDLTWSVSPAGVKFATTPIPTGHFPYDPSIYSPDGDPTTNHPTPFLVQHGMEYNPIAFNEVMAYSAQYGSSADAPNLTTYQAMFIELVNTLTEEVNNTGSIANSSAISIAGWDILITPDDFGWGRPDPISGDVNSIAFPPYVPMPVANGGDPTMPPLPSQRPNSTVTDPNLNQLQMAVQNYAIADNSTANNRPIITALNSAGASNYFVIGDYRQGSTSIADPTNPPIEGTVTTMTSGTTGNTTTTFTANPVAKANEINVRLPLSFPIPNAALGKAQYYWIYLRRPANPFDVAPPNQVRPNKEMVVVDAMRFPVINAANETLTPGNATKGPSVTPATTNANAIYSAQRLQPFRGGHLVRLDTTPPSGLPTTGPAKGVTTIAPPSPPYAYGYSEQTAQPPTLTGSNLLTAIYQYTMPSKGYLPTSASIQQSINDRNPTQDAAWNHLPLHDRDFSSVAELLLVPSCPPGLFTKQFVEEQYPGNIVDNSNNPATGTDDRDFATLVKAPTKANNPSQVGRQNFNATNLPANPSYPYLSDNFYYTAASVMPPTAGGGLDPQYIHLTTEIGGWTGAGWHKMLEFFEVPSSANGAIGTSDGGNNYDWARNDVKPGLLNLNLIIDEEVFAGLIDDPRLNENLAYNSSSIPAVVNQIDGYGYPVHDTNSGLVYGAQPIFSLPSSNPTTTGVVYSVPAGRGYAIRDADYGDTNGTLPATPQLLHGMKAAFADFLKLRHGGSGYLFAFGSGPTGSGDYPPPIVNNPNGNLYPVFQGSPYLSLPLASTTQPIAIERPYRSLSYPDINYTIMRPASLPPSIALSATSTAYPTIQSTPPIPVTNLTQLPDGTVLKSGLEALTQYTGVTNFPYVQLQPTLAPMNQASLMPTPDPAFQYVYDPGLKNPFLPIQFVNQTSPQSNRQVAPPYSNPAPAPVGPAPQSPAPAPFPPTIPPTPALRLFEVPDHDAGTGTYSSNASILTQVNSAARTADLAGTATNAQLAMEYTINRPTTPPQLSTGLGSGSPSPPSLVVPARAVFLPDNVTPQSNTTIKNLLGSGGATDYRQHPLYRTEWLQKVMNLTTVRTHQFAVWITVGFFEVVRPGTPELGIPDVLGQELGLTAGKNVRYRSFFTLDRTKATGFNPYYPGNFRDVVTYRRRIE